MATGKRYYWIKLKETFMTSDAVDFLMGQPDGANYVVLYQMLCLKTINTGGKLERHIGEVIIPYDEAKIQRDTKWFSIDTVRVALNLYKALGLVYQDQNGALALADYENLVGSETNWAAQKRNQRGELPPAQGGGHCPPDCPPDVPADVHPDIEIRDRDKSLEIDTEEDIENEIDSSPASEAAAVLTMLLNDGTDYPIHQDYIDKMQALYPAVNVLQELRSMSAWCINNPKKRKTKNGITRFIGSWLAREQDRGGARDFQPQRPAAQRPSKGKDAVSDLVDLHRRYQDQR